MTQPLFEASGQGHLLTLCYHWVMEFTRHVTVHVVPLGFIGHLWILDIFISFKFFLPLKELTR
jgi:hypothetical protein